MSSAICESCVKLEAKLYTAGRCLSIKITRDCSSPSRYSVINCPSLFIVSKLYSRMRLPTRNAWNNFCLQVTRKQRPATRSWNGRGRSGDGEYDLSQHVQHYRAHYHHHRRHQQGAMKPRDQRTTRPAWRGVLCLHKPQLPNLFRSPPPSAEVCKQLLEIVDTIETYGYNTIFRADLGTRFDCNRAWFLRQSFLLHKNVSRFGGCAFRGAHLWNVCYGGRRRARPHAQYLGHVS